ncbi:polysaccharide deacetylase family protein [Nitrospina gracilis]|nr:polysaccharide deacetylase family protein [Nitrospina gracilis]
MLEIHHPKIQSEAVDWILSVIFGEFLGIEYIARSSTEKGYCLQLNGKRLDLADSLFPQLQESWLIDEPMVKIPLVLWDASKLGLSVSLTDPLLPVVFGEPYIDIESNRVDCHIDILGTAFYFLSRYEELVIKERDKYDRFPATASLAYRAGLLERPIVEEYVEILWACMKHLWPALERKTRQGKVRVSCDVDAPYDCSTKTALKLGKGLAADILKRCNFGLARQRLQNYVSTQRGNFNHDPFNTFDWYMDTCERFGHQAAFYFIVDHSSELMDGCYEMSEPRIQDLLHRIAERGHEIGTHASFNTYQNRRQLESERQRLIDTCDKLGINASAKGNRQHYLRWDTSQTPDHIDASGYEYDTTGGFADRPGFRYGTSRPFTMWSWKKMKPLNVKQQPLVLMECSVFADRYMGLGYNDEAMDLMQSLKEKSLAYGGDFTLLWHNSHLSTELDKKFFAELIA